MKKLLRLGVIRQKIGLVPGVQICLMTEHTNNPLSGYVLEILTDRLFRDSRIFRFRDPIITRKRTTLKRGHRLSHKTLLFPCFSLHVLVRECSFILLEGFQFQQYIQVKLYKKLWEFGVVVWH